jgi:hypothetical protein
MMVFRSAMLVAMIALPTIASADARSDEAAGWIATLLHNKKPDSLGTRTIEIVFDSGKLFAADTPCRKLRYIAKATAADLATLAGCMQSAAKQLALDGAPAPDPKALRSVGVKYLRSWFHAPLNASIVVPNGHHVIGDSINRSTNSQGNGVGIMIYVRFDASDRIMAIYAYAGGWAYPV